MCSGVSAQRKREQLVLLTLHHMQLGHRLKHESQQNRNTFIIYEQKGYTKRKRNSESIRVVLERIILKFKDYT